MKHTQSWLQGALSTGEGWIKNAGNFMNKHRYLIGGAIGGAAIGLAGLAAARSDASGAVAQLPVTTGAAAQLPVTTGAAAQLPVTHYGDGGYNADDEEGYDSD